MAFEWNHEKIETLVNEYRLRSELWDPKDNNYHIKNRKSDSWREIASEVGCDVGEAKSKMTSLLSSFRREKAKEKKSQNVTGSGRAQIYVSTWFAYKLFAFLKEKDTPSNTLNTENVPIEPNSPGDDDEEDSNEPEPVLSIANKSTATAPPATTSTQRTFAPPQPKKKRQSMSIGDSRLAQAYSIMDNAGKTTSDECATFGQHIAAKLRKFDCRNRNYLMHKISSLIYETEMDVDRHSSQQLSSDSSRSQSTYSAFRYNTSDFENSSSSKNIYLQSPNEHRSTSGIDEYQPRNEPTLLHVFTAPDNPLQSFINDFEDND